MTHFYPKLDTEKYPISELLTVADDPTESDVIRESAFMAYSCFSHPSVWVKLHDVAATPAHPGWRVAVSRLASIGNSFTLQCLSDLDESTLAPADAELLATTKKNYLALVANQQNNDRPMYNAEISQRTALERAAVAELTESPVAEQLTAWTVRELAGGVDSKGLVALRNLRDTYEPTIENKVGTGTMKEWGRGLARKVLATVKQ
ncbi:MAG: hypothetical protein O2820_19250 [Planctomycetota bacterium]|nr:hypothetical protein [Planctomycetota bacterium]MDA1251352.1 hypothetical protein [Planctomycetota bacterium]